MRTWSGSVIVLYRANKTGWWTDNVVVSNTSEAGAKRKATKYFSEIWGTKIRPSQLEIWGTTLI